MADARETTGSSEAAGAVRQLIRGSATAALSSLLRDGSPHGSLVLSACGLDAAPVLLISHLAVHTRNLKSDPRVALLYEDTGGLENPLTGPRATIIGRAEPVEDERLVERYLRRHPNAAMYAEFSDFGFHRVVVEYAHYVAGFGKVERIKASDLLLQDGSLTTELALREADILSHMNGDHADAVADIAALAGVSGASDEPWVLVGCDAEGIDLRRGGDLARCEFDDAMTSADDARSALVGLTDKARNAKTKTL